MVSDRPDRVISVVGLGYVGLPVACAFAAGGYRVIAFDIDAGRIAELKDGIDRTGEVEPQELAAPLLHLTGDAQALREADFHIVTVPTPITRQRLPDLGPLLAASRTVGRVLKRGDIVVYESTVYPGATEEDCVPVLEAESGLIFGRDFTVGYSPERINPGDHAHRFATITKVVSGSDPATRATVAAVYGAVVRAGIHEAPSIKVAEAAKVIENTQRDLNIALMNELALIFDRVGIATSDVLDAAATKWNFQRFSPGLVGGHCIGVDPYYLTAKAEALGYHPQMILAGRRINDAMGHFIGEKLVKLLLARGRDLHTARVAILGLTFKENVPDLRNSRVPDIIAELGEYGIRPLVHDALAEAREAERAYGVALADWGALDALDAVVLAVPHGAYVADEGARIASMLAPGAVVIDVRSAIKPGRLPKDVLHWRL
ncbi:nucleotide sugar dehydrogenase [Chelatococcus daeguensis]|uniref:UDP-N-acetyl-D-galactosamine dehydrogenase n=2 Tax=Chelatococcus TaxID=28209 RepID=A0AAC9JW87_9HYPH|nr:MULTISPECIES: nucleotide sugar dehydrogenase [Chelatococcus]APF38432.1 UDP-N-acetyl-D-galactosamine dehydrogenase [Chelatococcus daeguensis]KZE34563.1 UDP-N-acetyl-D-galactosamine dehydrogenase [Chelatococcus daeguensis]MBM3083125.1 nucleotide sugar dehydrogenase [Chelatococcus daeguensis]CUA85044.1 nucleotide sugar dehydrogenase [Chelatococcus sambhunathii]